MKTEINVSTHRVTEEKSLQSLLRAPLQDPERAMCMAHGGNEDSDIWPGDLVAINFTVNRFDTDAVFVVEFDGALAFRRVQRIPTEKGTSICMRQDGKYEAMSNGVLSSIRVVGRVEEVFHSDRNEERRMSTRECARRASK